MYEAKISTLLLHKCIYVHIVPFLILLYHILAIFNKVIFVTFVLDYSQLWLPQLVNWDLLYLCRAEIENPFTWQSVSSLTFCHFKFSFIGKLWLTVLSGEWFFLGTDMFQLYSLSVLISIIWCIKYWIYFKFVPN